MGEDYSLDARKRSGNNFISFYSLIENDPYAIQTIPQVTDQVMNVNLGFNLAEAGTYTIFVQEFDGIQSDVDVLLVNNESGEQHNLRERSEISFTIEEGQTNNGLFTLTFDPGEPEVITALDDELSNLKVYGVQSQLVLEHGKLDGLHTVGIITLDGKQVFQNQVRFVDGKASVAPRIEAGRVYVLRIGNESVKFIKNH
jgi:hypothetical protein